MVEAGKRYAVITWPTGQSLLLLTSASATHPAMVSVKAVRSARPVDGETDRDPEVGGEAVTNDTCVEGGRDRQRDAEPTAYY